MKKSLAFLIALLLIGSFTFATDYASLWGWDSISRAYTKGLQHGLSWGPTIRELQDTLPESRRDLRTRMMFDVYTKVNKLDPDVVVRVMIDLYRTPENGSIEPQVLFFAAAAKVLGYSDGDVSEMLRLLRSSRF